MVLLMAWTVSVVSVVVFVGAFLCGAIGLAALRKRPDPMAWPLAALMFAGVLWAIPHGLSFGASSADQVFFWNKLIYPGAALVPVAYLVLALRYAGYDRWLSWRLYAALCVVPVVTVTAAWTDPLHSLFFASYEVEYVGNAASLTVMGGPLFWLDLLYSYLLVGLAWLVFARVVVGSGPMYRNQALLMLFGGMLPTLLNVLFNLGVGPFPAVDLTSSALAISGAAFAVALFRYDLLGLTPAAYRSVPDLFADGVLVFDENERLVEANDHAAEILDTPVSVGTPAEELFDTSLDSLDGTVLTADGATQRMYTVRYSPLHNQRDELVGHALVMREVTDLKEHQQRLSVTNRVLRHNLRNELNVILGEADQLEERASVETRESLQRLRAAATRLYDVGEKARHIQTSLGIDPESLLVVDLVRTVDGVVEHYRQVYPDAEIRYDAPASAPVLAAGTDSLKTVVRNVVENALEHNDSEQPTVDVNVFREGETVIVRVADDGPGIPPAEYEVLGESSETQLQHGSSLGLWLTYWLVSAMDGDIEFGSNKPRGSVVTLRFQAADEPVDIEQPVTGLSSAQSD
jgi:signal transduction histidine kinase